MSVTMRDVLFKMLDPEKEKSIHKEKKFVL